MTRPITLKGVDGIIFVADSQKDVYERNIIAWKELCAYFSETITDLPKVIAFNKQDVPNKFNPLGFLHEIEFDTHKNIETLYTIALNGEGILDTFETILRLIFADLYKKGSPSLLN